MVDREQRDLLVVPYIPPPPPRRHFVLATASAILGLFSMVGLGLADYSAAITAWLIVGAALGLVVAIGLLLIGLRVRYQFRGEMERAVGPVPVHQASDGSTTSIEVI